jgi:hypothetical protein
MPSPPRAPAALVALAGLALAASGPVLAQDPPAGRVLFEAQGCNLCHAVPAAGVAKAGDPTVTGPDLVGLGDEHSRCGLKRWLRRTKMHDGLTHLQRFQGSDEDLDVLVRWLLEQ